jgi:hypothetical protein
MKQTEPQTGGGCLAKLYEIFVWLAALFGFLLF